MRDGGRRSRRCGVGSCLLLAALWIACQSPARDSLTLGGELPARLGGPAGAHWDFSASRAFADLERLARIGPRVSGTPGAERARAQLRRSLEELGAGVEQWSFEIASPDPAVESLQVVSLVGVLEGESPDVLLLAAHYDTPRLDGLTFIGANDGASGAALLLELGRVLGRRPRPYTIWLLFIDGDGQASGFGPAAEPVQSVAGRFPGSNALAAWLASRGELARVRLAVFFNRVADPDLAIARDLRSHPIYREVFWQSARDLGLVDAFARERGFETSDTGHRAFIENHLRRVVAIVDNRHGPGDVPGRYWHSEQDTPKHCSPASLRQVGVVTLEALDRIARRLSRIDRFSRSPLEDVLPERTAAPMGTSPAAQEESEAGTPPAAIPERDRSL